MRSTSRSCFRRAGAAQAEASASTADASWPHPSCFWAAGCRRIGASVWETRPPCWPCSSCPARSFCCSRRRRKAAICLPEQLLRVDNLLHVCRADLPRRLVELRAQPAHHGRQIGQLALLDYLEHAGITTFPLPGLAHAIGAARQCHIEAPLLTANPSGSHGKTPLLGPTSKEIKITRR